MSAPAAILNLAGPPSATSGAPPGAEPPKGFTIPSAEEVATKEPNAPAQKLDLGPNDQAPDQPKDSNAKKLPADAAVMALVAMPMALMPASAFGEPTLPRVSVSAPAEIAFQAVPQAKTPLNQAFPSQPSTPSQETPQAQQQGQPNVTTPGAPKPEFQHHRGDLPQFIPLSQTTPQASKAQGAKAAAVTNAQDKLVSPAPTIQSHSPAGPQGGSAAPESLPVEAAVPIVAVETNISTPASDQNSGLVDATEPVSEPAATSLSAPAQLTTVAATVSQAPGVKPGKAPGSRGTSQPATSVEAVLEEQPAAEPKSMQPQTSEHRTPGARTSSPAGRPKAISEAASRPIEIDKDEPAVKASPDAESNYGSEGRDRETPALGTSEATESIDGNPMEVSPQFAGTQEAPAIDSVKPKLTLDRPQTQAVIRQITDRIEFMAAVRPRDGITVHLQPQGLGTVSLVVKSVGKLVDAQILASNPDVRDALENSKAQLASSVEHRGMQLNTVTVGSQPSGSSTAGQQQSFSRQASQSDAAAAQQGQQQQNQGRTSTGRILPTSGLTPETQELQSTPSLRAGSRMEIAI